MASPNISLPEEPGSRFVVLAPAPAAEETTPMASAGGLNFRYVAAVVRANLRVIAFIFAVVMALAVVVTLVQTPRYTAKTTVQINNASSRVLKNQSDDKQDDEEGATSTDTDRFLKTQVDIIKSRALALRVAQKLNLLHDTRLFKAEGASLPTPDLSPDALNDRVIGLLRGHTTVDLPRDSRVVSITVESTDPHLSADIANAYASEYIQSNLKRRFDSSSYARDFIASQLAEMKGKLEESERGLNTYSRQAGLIHMAAASGGDNKSAAQGGSVTVSSLMQVNQAANEAKARRIQVKSFPQHGAAIGDVAQRSQVGLGMPPIGSGTWNPPTVAMDPESGQGKPFSTYVYATQIAEVEVDDETGEVEILRICAAHDCGTPVNPMLVEGQVEGGVAMGIGFALQEEILFDREGRQINPNLTNYIMPTALDVPEIMVDIVDSYDPTGPFGAKGVGEPSLVPTAAAICNAIFDAVGARIKSLPATPERVLAAIKAAQGSETHSVRRLTEVMDA